MKPQPPSKRATAAPRRRTQAELRERADEDEQFPMMSALRQRAEAQLRQQRRNQKSKAQSSELSVPSSKSPSNPQRSLHELQVYQIELELQNTELLAARDRMEVLLESYTDLYDFAPVGYFSLDEQGVILEVNLTGATLLGVERSRLIRQRWERFVINASRPGFLTFLKQVFARPEKQVCEALLLNEAGVAFWADLQAVAAVSLDGPKKWCRLAVSDITVLKRADEAQRRLEALALSNRELQKEIVQRHEVEVALKESEGHQGQLLEQSRRMQEQLRHLSHQILTVQEEERKRISRELHDVIVQTLTGIGLQLAGLKKAAGVDTKSIAENISTTQRLVEQSVGLVHRFALELRPPVLDDLGLIPALRTFLKIFREQTGLHATLTAVAAVEQLHGDKRTVLYRVAQEALTNVARHAQASRVEVKIRKLDGHVSLEVTDNGKGFQTGSGLPAKTNPRLGLVGMSERVAMVHGKLTIKSIPGKGTTVCVQIPTQASEALRKT